MKVASLLHKNRHTSAISDGLAILATAGAKSSRCSSELWVIGVLVERELEW